MDKSELKLVAEEIKKFRAAIPILPAEEEKIKGRFAMLVARIAAHDPAFSPKWFFDVCGLPQYNSYALREHEVRKIIESHYKEIKDAFLELNQAQFLSVLDEYGIDITGYSYVEQLLGER